MRKSANREVPAAHRHRRYRHPWHSLALLCDWKLPCTCVWMLRHPRLLFRSAECGKDSDPQESEVDMPTRPNTNKANQSGSATSVIPRNEWGQFLATFTRLHEGWLTKLETNDLVTHESVVSPEMPLQSIELDLEDEKNPRINVTVKLDNKDLKHILFQPSRLVLC